MKLDVKVDRRLPAIVPNAVSFETGLTSAQLTECIIGYEHHGAEFSTESRGALPAFYEDLILGKPFPATFATHAVHDIDTLLAMALFLHRDLALHPAMPGIVGTFDLIHRLGLPALAHVPEPVARFASALRAHFPDRLPPRELGARITSAVGWLREYVLNDRIPNVLGPRPNHTLKILETGDNGFVFGEAEGSLWDCWVAVYRLGYLRGALMSPPIDGRRQVLIARKSRHLGPDLHHVQIVLNQMEAAMGEEPEWRIVSNLWLEGPARGTLVLAKHLLAVLTHV